MCEKFFYVEENLLKTIGVNFCIDIPKRIEAAAVLLNGKCRPLVRLHYTYAET